MEIGEKSHFLLAPELAYGKTGCLPTVPAGWLIYSLFYLIFLTKIPCVIQTIQVNAA